MKLDIRHACPFCGARWTHAEDALCIGCSEDDQRDEREVRSVPCQRCGDSIKRRIRAGEVNPYANQDALDEQERLDR